MAGISRVSNEAMLANPALIPMLPRGAEVRSLDGALENARHPADERVREIFANTLDGSVLAPRAQIILQTCSAPSFRPAEKSGCKELETVLNIAGRVQFTTEEVAFIQYHEIGGQKYIFIADCHENEKFKQLWARLGHRARDREFAIFRESSCRDPQSEKDYDRFQFKCAKPGMPSPWIFGLEGPAWPLQFSVMYLLERKRTQERDRLIGFVHDFRINRPWDQVLEAAEKNKHLMPPTPAAAALFKEIQISLKVMETPEAYAQNWPSLYGRLVKNHSEIAWRDLIFHLAKTCLMDVPSIQKAFSAPQSEFILKLFRKPKAEDSDRFKEEINIQMRDLTMANALFSTELPKGTVRLAMAGYLHLPGIIRELERLAASQKPQESKKA